MTTPYAGQIAERRTAYAEALRAAGAIRTDPGAGTAWTHTDGTMTTTRSPEIGDQLTTLVQHWDTTGRPRVGDWIMQWRDTHRTGLLLPHRWVVPT